MTMKVIGAGVGRTGTYSLMLAINQLGFGPCFHMEEVLHAMPKQVPLWTAALTGNADWQAIYSGYNSAVDWPTAGFFKELISVYPMAKFILTERSAESWADSFAPTIYQLLAEKDSAPIEMKDWLAMSMEVIHKSGIPLGLNRQELMKAYTAHNDAVKNTIPADQLLVFDVKQGWQPLCEFLGVPVPNEPFPRSNDRGEFWDRVTGKI
ncbi:sulfotransferase family protein [Paraglaciecola hydrolytica]|uniref:Sulfotransferase family protein n=1 Tax=Paraglaciecola hydrolytica TaxID=1799789 RepID=A0A136A5A7_9ALTE|nr:sulfotransferase family protein [Paraglaciecola hydrolytica]KXI30407.1 hypothetical protein AX660_10590 [Paraglaciecola hydrolytica]